MKKCFPVSIVLISLLLFAFTFSGCIFGGEDEEDVIGPEKDSISGFASLKSGSWEELAFPDGTRERNEFLGTDTYKGVECYLIESETISSSGKEITQIWFNKSNMQVVLIVMKDRNGKVIKIEAIPTLPTKDVPTGEVPSNSVKIGTEKYTTPTGKTIEATVYKITAPDGESEIWMSSQVPFWQVKDILNGKVVYDLYDFGTSGAKRDISKQEMENASSLEFPGDNGWDN